MEGSRALWRHAAPWRRADPAVRARGMAAARVAPRAPLAMQKLRNKPNHGRRNPGKMGHGGTLRERRHDRRSLEVGLRRPSRRVRPQRFRPLPQPPSSPTPPHQSLAFRPAATFPSCLPPHRASPLPTRLPFPFGGVAGTDSHGRMDHPKARLTRHGYRSVTWLQPPCSPSMGPPRARTSMPKEPKARRNPPGSRPTMSSLRAPAPAT
jgi:hypothetical protein